MLIQKITVNTYAKTRVEYLNGREHLVAPLRLIVPGVLNGSKGPLYYPLQEIAKNPEAWNGMPLVRNHPIVNGNHVSARSPEILNQFSMGLVLRSRVDNKGRLIAEGWFDSEKTKKVDVGIYNSLKNNRPIELSTGLFTDNYPAPPGSQFNGKFYSYTARNYRPDHLAILPDQVGACSLRDGCGVLVNSSLADRVRQVLNFNPSQPRDSRGRFGSGGGGGSGGVVSIKKNASDGDIYELMKEGQGVTTIKDPKTGEKYAYSGKSPAVDHLPSLGLTLEDFGGDKHQVGRYAQTILDYQFQAEFFDKKQTKPGTMGRVRNLAVDRIKEIIANKKSTAQRVQEVLNYNPSQPRDARGRFGSGGGGGGGGASKPTDEVHDVKLPVNPKKLTIGPATKAMEQMGYKLGGSKTDLKTGKTSYQVTSPDGKKSSMTTDEIKSKVYKGRVEKSVQEAPLTGDEFVDSYTADLEKWNAKVKAKAEAFNKEPITKTPPPPYDPDVDSKGTDGVTTHARVGVPANELPPPPPIGRMPNLTPQERKVEGKFIRAFEADPEGMTDKFLGMVKQNTKPGEAPVFGTDDAKALTSAWSHPDPEVRAKNRATLNTPLHQTANAVAKRAFVKHLDTLAPGDEVLVTVGGCGAGKGHALKNVPEALDMKKRSKAVWDSAGDQNATENPWIQRELEKRNLKGNYVYVHADPKNQWAHPERGVVKRAGDPADGRMVDAKVFADSYAIGAKNHKAFHDNHKESEHANFVFLENSGTPKKLDGIPNEALNINRSELAAFAIATVADIDTPAHVKRGALSGTRIWND